MLKLVDRLFYETHWECIYRSCNDKNHNKDFYLIETTRRYWCADPFIIKEGEEYYFFCEAMDRKKSKGLLAIGKLNSNGNSQIEAFLDLGCHTSYPNIFKYDNEWYIIPETLERKTIELYKCIEFPCKWKKEITLLSDISAVDTTTFIYNNRVYLFIYQPNEKNNILSIAELDMINFKLGEMKKLICYSDKIGRPAGGIYLSEEKLIRPTQYGVNTYGEKIINKSFTLGDDFVYEELFYSEITPKTFKSKHTLMGTHTYNRCDNFEIYDIKFKKFILFRPIELLLKKLNLFGYRFN